MLHRMSNGLGIFSSIAAKNNRAIHVSEMPDLTGNSTKIAFSHNHTRNRWHPTSDQRLVARGARGRASQGDRAASVLSHRLDGNGSAASSGATTRWPRPWTTCSGSSTSSRAFSTTAASAWATIRPSVNCTELLSPVNHGCSRVLTVAARTPRSC